MPKKIRPKTEDVRLWERLSKEGKTYDEIAALGPFECETGALVKYSRRQIGYYIKLLDREAGLTPADMRKSRYLIVDYRRNFIERKRAKSNNRAPARNQLDIFGEDN